MLFPVLVPAGYALLTGTGSARIAWVKRLAGVALCVGAVGVMVLIGQRMPVLLTLFGLVVTAAWLPRLRGAVAIAIVGGAALLAASVVISPRTFYRLVTKFSSQMADFPDSPYGQIAGRSLAIAGQHPLMGRGYEGFRTGCPMPRYFVGWHWPGMPASDDGGGAAICVTHPHSFYLQALTDAGLPGLLLFCLLVGAWLYLLGRCLVRQPDPLRVGLFVAVLLQVWPIASTSPLISMPIGGWCFLLVGFGLAESRAAERGQRTASAVSQPAAAAPA
jgi:O-antigen ligase